MAAPSGQKRLHCKRLITEVLVTCSASRSTLLTHYANQPAGSDWHYTVYNGHTVTSTMGTIPHTSTAHAYLR